MNSTKSYKPIIKNGDYLFDSDVEFIRPTEIHFVRMEEFDDPHAYKVLVLSSESCLSVNRESIESVIQSGDRYDLILCADDEILEQCPNSEMFLYGSTWLNRGNIKHPDGLGFFDPEHKSFQKIDKTLNDVSFLASWYSDIPGYRLRQEVWTRQEEIDIPIMFHTSRKAFLDAPNPLPTGEKEDLFYSMYHICIENQQVPNYFTEKLIDSFLTYTMPVYWGCPNITDYFDPDGMILFDTVDELIPKLNSLTFDYYYDRMDIVEKNRKIAESYANFGDRVAASIEEKL
jgi:hypothetical protein